jgi:hypothetical protein
MSRSTVVCRAGAALVLAGIAAGCSRGFERSAGAATLTPAATTTTLDRKTIRTAEQQVVVDSPMQAGRRVEQMVATSGGYIERSSSSTDGNVRITGRIPADQLDGFMNSVAALGDEKHRRMTGADVTDQYSDLEARLRSTIALRDRLQQLLTRASTLEEVLNLEKQIARLQTDIDALQSRLDQLKSQVELASLTVELNRGRVLGPLAQAGKGVVWLVSKLFVIR